MGELLRSQEMELVQIYMEMEAAHDTVDELGRLGLVQFRDLNPDANAFQRNFVADVQRCDELERKLRYFEEQIRKADIHIEDAGDIDADERSGKVLIDELEARFEELERDLRQLSTNKETLDRNQNQLVEMQHVLEKDASYFGHISSGGAGSDVPTDIESVGMRSPLLDRTGEYAIRSRNLGFVTGMLPREKMGTFERVLWRALRGNLFMRQAEVDAPIRDPNSGELVEKTVFIIFFQGERAEQKISKLCETFGANIYPCPESPQDREELRLQVRQRLSDLNTVLERSRLHSEAVLSQVASKLETWKLQVLREKSIYHAMNLFNYDVGRKCLIAEGWCPSEATDRVQLALRAANRRSGAQIPSILQPMQSRDTRPTYFKTNKYLESFQSITDAYGVARYSEVNPTIFSLVTFPFLFGVMFGDVGHGAMLFLFAAALVFWEEKLLKAKLFEMLEICFGGRYLLLVMSLFAMYCGFLYNECFALPMSLFPSNWAYPEPLGPGVLAVRTSPDYVYPFGVDPMWKGAANELDYYNSLKMKMSVLLGVIQMLLGIVLSLFNGLHFKKPLNIYFEFIPQIIFLSAIFGYMDLLIVFKWLKDWSIGDFPPTSTHLVPRLLNVLIQMLLSPWSIPPDYQLFNGQLYVQLTLVIVAAVCVPLMLLPKPLLLRRQHENAKKAYRHIEGDHDEHHEEDEFNFGEVMIHQIIHTIEFVLGSVSNTASYLRLWALSLAHAELSLVFWQMVMEFILIESPNAFMIFCAWAVWAALTIGVLLMMESLSAFLHALRLHWVEFQNKFYAADGYKFQPFSYVRIFAGEEDVPPPSGSGGGGH